MADAATTEERATLSRDPITRRNKRLVKEDEVLLKGTLCMVDTDGLAVAPSASTTDQPGGRVCATVDATGRDDLYVEYEEGIFKWVNAESSNAITEADAGLPAYAMNNQTVTDVSTGLSKCGLIYTVDPDDGGVWVQTEKGIV